jgi:hypothetical protein
MKIKSSINDKTCLKMKINLFNETIKKLYEAKKILKA